MPDFITLATAIHTEGAEELGRLFKVPISQDKFFLEVHMKLRPVDFATDGIFMCGLAHYPKPIDESIAQAQAAAARAATVLSRKSIEVEGVVSTVDESLCRGCGKCVAVCPYGAPQLVEKAGRRTDFHHPGGALQRVRGLRGGMPDRRGLHQAFQ